MISISFLRISYLNTSTQFLQIRRVLRAMKRKYFMSEKMSLMENLLKISIEYSVKPKAEP